jgi:hypothetical protein
MKKLVMIIVAVLSCVNFAYGYDFGYGGLYYTILSKEDKTVSVSKGSSKPTGDLVIPQRVSNNTTLYTVTAIGSFSGCTGLTSVTIPASVQTIGSYAFSGCSD